MKKLTLILMIALLASCKKETINQPAPVQPVSTHVDAIGKDGEVLEYGQMFYFKQ